MGKKPVALGGTSPCFRGELAMAGTNLHRPLAPKITRQGNNHSCVVKVDDGEQSVLLTGDIEAQAEQAMLSHYWRICVYTYTGSPSWQQYLVVIAAGTAGGRTDRAGFAARYNAWRFPSAKVVRRYRKRVYLARYAASGQISVTFSQHHWQIRRLRDQFLPVGIISGLARPSITGRICGYFNNAGF
jgi:competence protein ComEC